MVAMKKGPSDAEQMRSLRSRRATYASAEKMFEQLAGERRDSKQRETLYGIGADDDDDPVSPTAVREENQRRLQEVLARVEAQKRAEMTMRERAFEAVEGDKAMGVVGGVVVLNIIVLGVETELTAQNPDAEYVGLIVMNHFFTVFFIIEAVTKIVISPRRYFSAGFNLLDFSLVILSVLDTYFLADSSLGSFSGLKVLRMLRLVRLLKLLRMFKQLWLICFGLLESMRMLGWLGLLLGLIMYVFSIFAVMLVGRNPKYEELGFGDQAKALFDTVPKSFVTFYQMQTLDAWAHDITRVVLEVQPHLVPLFLLYMMLTTYGLLNVALAVIIDKTLDLAKSNDEVSEKRRKREEQRVEGHLTEIFNLADDDQSGAVDKDELVNALRDPEVLKLLHAVELPITNAEELFECFDDNGRGTFTLRKFITGCLRLRGTAKSRDLLSIQTSVETLNAQSMNAEQALVDSVEATSELSISCEYILSSIDRVEEALSNTGTRAWKSKKEHARWKHATSRKSLLNVEEFTTIAANVEKMQKEGKAYVPKVSS